MSLGSPSVDTEVLGRLVGDTRLTSTQLKEASN